MKVQSSHEEFLSLYEPVHTAFVRYCSSHAYGIMETDDLVQDTILATMQNFKTIREKEKLLHFMIRVANNIVNSKWRRMKFNGALSESQLLKLEGKTTDPALTLDIHYLYKALNQLPVTDKEAVILFEISGFSMNEIAVIQNTTEGATRTRVSRARQKLRELLTSDNVNYETSGGKILFSFIL